MTRGLLEFARYLRAMAGQFEEMAARCRAQAARIEGAVATVPADYATFPLYSQRDPAWSRKQLGPDRAGGTIGTKGCAVTSGAALSAFVGCGLDPGQLNARLREMDGFWPNGLDGPRNLLRWEKVAEICPELRWGGFLHYTGGPADMERIAELLEHGPVVAELDFDTSDRDVDQHFVVLLCMTADGDDAWALDPWTGEVVRVADAYYNPAWSAPAGKVARVITGLRLLQPKQAKPLRDPAPPVVEPDPDPDAIGARGVRGVHGAPVPYPPPAERWGEIVEDLQRMRVSTYLQLVAAAGAADRRPMLEWLRYLIAHEITPIVRIYQEGQGSAPLADVLMEWLPDLRDARVLYVLLGQNELNLAREWPLDEYPDWHDTAQVRKCAESFWGPAQVALSLGLRPGIPPFAPTEVGPSVPNPTASSIQWARGFMRELAQLGGDTLEAAMRTGRVWVATHTAQFDLPLDAETQGPGDLEWDMCMRGYEWMRDACLVHVGVDPVMVSTEGGVYSPSHLADMQRRPDYDWEQWGPKVVDMYRFVEQSTHLAALCSWTFSDELVTDPFHLRCGWRDQDGRPRSPVLAMRAP